MFGVRTQHTHTGIVNASDSSGDAMPFPDLYFGIIYK